MEIDIKSQILIMQFDGHIQHIKDIACMLAKSSSTECNIHKNETSLLTTSALHSTHLMHRRENIEQKQQGQL